MVFEKAGERRRQLLFEYRGHGLAARRTARHLLETIQGSKAAGATYFFRKFVRKFPAEARIYWIVPLGIVFHFAATPFRPPPHA